CRLPRARPGSLAAPAGSRRSRRRRRELRSLVDAALPVRRVVPVLGRRLLAVAAHLLLGLLVLGHRVLGAVRHRLGHRATSSLTLWGRALPSAGLYPGRRSPTPTGPAVSRRSPPGPRPARAGPAPAARRARRCVSRRPRPGPPPCTGRRCGSPTAACRRGPR